MRWVTSDTVSSQDSLEGVEQGGEKGEPYSWHTIYHTCGCLISYHDQKWKLRTVEIMSREMKKQIVRQCADAYYLRTYMLIKKIISPKIYTSVYRELGSKQIYYHWLISLLNRWVPFTVHIRTIISLRCFVTIDSWKITAQINCCYCFINTTTSNQVGCCLLETMPFPEE